MKLLETSCSSDVRCLEVEEAEVWSENRQASREHNRTDRIGFKDGAKSWHRRDLALNHRRFQIMLLRRQHIFEMVRDG